MALWANEWILVLKKKIEISEEQEAVSDISTILVPKDEIEEEKKELRNIENDNQIMAKLENRSQEDFIIGQAQSEEEMDQKKERFLLIIRRSRSQEMTSDLIMRRE